MDTLGLVSLLAAIGCGLVGGFFYAFSVCVMKALAALPPSQGIAAMQSINVVVLNPWFLGLFVGLVAPCAWLAGSSFVHWDDPRAGYHLLAGLSYLLGTFLVTMVCNVPRNDALAALKPSSPEATTAWASYVSSWTLWNHVRAAGSCTACVLFTLSLRAAG